MNDWHCDKCKRTYLRDELSELFAWGKEEVEKPEFMAVNPTIQLQETK